MNTDVFSIYHCVHPDMAAMLWGDLALSRGQRRKKTAQTASKTAAFC
ncbi:MAG: hypothetical protein PHT60_12315 [Acidiphilium sp.]|nr:hypothetical protein [Acidiphilium sp.]MDD4936545.1 hypothetical protein [Acidiphilium sp.]